MNTTAKQLAKLLNAPIIGSSNPEIESIFFDSRKIIQGTKAVFFALSGSQKDGHDYTLDAYKKGVRTFVVKRSIPGLGEAAQIIHPEPLKALQKWATTHREQYTLPVIGITGSNGKTITKEWLNSLLHNRYRLARSPKSYNSQIGVALSLLQLGEQHELAIIEAGISTKNEMVVLQKMIRPTIGVLTNVGSAHEQGFANRKEHIREKLKLFKDVSELVYFTNDSAVFELTQEILPKTKLIGIGKKESDRLKILDSKIQKGSTKLLLEWENKRLHLTIPFRDKASLQNALSCLAVTLLLGIPFEEIAEEFLLLEPVSMRLEFIEGIQGNRIISDVFNSDLHSLEIALEGLSEQSNPKKALFLSDILQSSLEDSTLYRKVAEVVNQHALQELILVGDVVPRFAHLFSTKTHLFPDTEAVLERFEFSKLVGLDILVKGARPFAFERIIQKLERQNHETVLEVKQDSLIHNLNYFRSYLQANTKVMIMVKALSYGTGNVEIAELLERQKVDYLGVAFADEGIALRKAGVSLPIMVLNPEMRSHAAMLEYSLEPEVYTLRMAAHLFNEWRKNQSDSKLKIHLKINTGMNRLGFSPDSISDFLALYKKQKDVEIASVFTHLATADSDADFAKKQITQFDAVYEKICLFLEKKPMRHVLNTAGIVNHTQNQYEMVRLGIGLYGFIHDKKIQKELQNVVYFQTIISQINSLKKGDSVGYGQAFVAQKEMRIATLPVGYADGVTRSLGNGKGFVQIQGKKAPILGSICMDMLMVDVSDIRCNEGDSVLLFGDSPTVLDWAAWQNSIPYEVLTGISSRVKRIYSNS